MFNHPVRRLFADITPLQESRTFRRLFFGTALASTGQAITAVAVGLQVYDVTGSTFSVGLVGAFAVVPLIVLGLYGGSVVDAHDRRAVMLLSGLGMLAAAVAITLQAFAGLQNVWLLYLIVAAQSGCYALNSPARTAIVPRLISPEQLPAANALSGLNMALNFMLGPLLAGFLVDWVGYGLTYLVEAVMLVFALTLISGLPAIPPIGPARPAGLRSVWEGLDFLRTRTNIRMTFLVDLAAMVLAMPRVLFPALAALNFGGGAKTVGLLGAALAVGSVGAGVFSGPLGRVRRQGRAVVIAVACWGIVIAAAGAVILGARAPADGSVNPLLWPAAGLLAVAGVCDQISAVFRMTILQAATPDGMRGRLQGVFTVVVAGGPRLGDILLGAMAGIIGEPGTAVAGGIACVVVVLLLAARWPGFLRYDAQHPTP